MIIVLGAGMSGLLAAQRLREKQKRFVIIDSKGINQSHNDSGFFYSHEPVGDYTAPNPIKIETAICRDGSNEDYRKKVYGTDTELFLDKPLSFLGYKDVPLQEGWPYNEKLTQGLEVIRDEAYCIDIKGKLLYTTSGRVWKYEGVISTIPLPLIIPIIRGPMLSAPELHSSPVYVFEEFVRPLGGSTPKIPYSKFIIPAPQWSLEPQSPQVHARISGITYGDILVIYCPSTCHKWYRASVTKSRVSVCEMARIRYEFMEPMQGCRYLWPGKIWYSSQKNKESVARMLDELRRCSIYPVGRYASWSPKFLANEAYDQVNSLPL